MYDTAGRQTETHLVTQLKGADEGEDYYTSGAFNYRSTDTDPADKVIQMTRTTYDTAGNATKIFTLEANHDQADGLEDDVISTFVQTFTYMWYDEIGRLTTRAYYGSGGATWTGTITPPAYSKPSSSGPTCLVTKYAYNTAGRLETITDPEDIDTMFFYDDLGRKIFVAENHDDAAVSSGAITDTGGDPPEQDRVTGYTYDGVGNVLTQTAYDTNGDGATTSGDDQTTTYTYYNDTRSPHHVSLATQIEYPDKKAGVGGDVVTLEYALDGRLTKRTAQKHDNGHDATEIEYTYDATFRRRTMQAVTEPGTGVDESVLSITYEYDDLGRRESVLSHNSATPDTDPAEGYDDAVNHVKFSYTDLGLLEKEFQEHEEGGVTGNSLFIEYAYDDTASDDVFTKAMRLESVTYPNTRTLPYDYGTEDGISDKLSRREGIKSDPDRPPYLAIEAQIVSYSFNGAGRPVLKDYPGNIDVYLDHYGGTPGKGLGEAGGERKLLRAVCLVRLQ